ncbi:hypothetical protein [Endozoicomonas ascidiicola]|uniref:hypothetical protein n=1 Tax=Endozoicomonas ascidiicola TaxID=1698521 RepID=UPI000A41311C|nr:hypothetical protein [Endozoicomonas ascidiicola]
MLNFLRKKDPIVSSAVLSANHFEPPKPLETAVLFLVFNRSDTTKEVFEAIRKARPPRLYIAGDGARTDHEGEVEKVARVREISTAVDWPCEVKTLFREDNLGCKLAVSGGINWFFEHEEQGIILEDDCLPSQSFFWFCEELLTKYKNNERVMHIAGMCYQEPNTEFSYNFVRIGGIWGWASWKRAWKLYEPDFSSYDSAIKEKVLENVFFGNGFFVNLYRRIFSLAHKNNHTWDYQWTCTKIINNSVNIMPSVNLVENIGIGHQDATHIKDQKNPFEKVVRKELVFPLVHRKFLVIGQENDYRNLEFSNQVGLRKMIKYFVSKLLR